VPWDEPASTEHPTEPGRVYAWGDVHQPRSPVAGETFMVGIDLQLVPSGGSVISKPVAYIRHLIVRRIG
jgi:hypothetical protein